MADSTIRVAVIGPAHLRIQDPGVQWHVSLASLLAGDPCDVVLLDLPGSQAGQVLRSLRQEPNYRYSLIFCRQDQDAWCEALGDGQAPVDHDGLVSAWMAWRTRYGQLDKWRFDEYFETRVLTWLWLRLNRQVCAVRNPERAQHYEYPLLDVLASGERINSFVWLQLMNDQGWLEGRGLVDRLRLCAQCGSGRQNYIDVCPECQSIGIARQPALHCFVCGHVSAQENFLKDGVLLCPNCLSRLRHIGTDYDRPIENYRCRNCQAFFVDAAVQARCMDCGAVHVTDELRVHEVHNYGLTVAGRVRCREGFESSSPLEEHNRLGLLGVRSFHHSLDWMLEIQRRYRKPVFSLLGLRFVHLSNAVERLGDQQGRLLVDTLIERLLESMFETDRYTRVNEECLWVLLPLVDADDLARVKQRLEKLSDLFAASEAKEIELRVAGFTAPQDLLEDEDGELLMARLMDGLS
ncbi:MAG: diguanylate cyclase [Burkholderiaceae bacterium]|nr:MAG: diguanylate cyclase [Burkholderiaceae bacterium]